jgi:hypothetical protein
MNVSVIPARHGASASVRLLPTSTALVIALATGAFFAVVWWLASSD